MQISRRFMLTASVATLAAGCSKFATYDGPEVTRVAVWKTDRIMALYSGDQVLEQYNIQLGFTAAGPKQFEGDGKTPEGRYHINRRNPNSAFYLSLGIDYPNDEDRAYARSQGKRPGGDIFIHGGSKRYGKRSDDWTAGCIAVRNREMKQIYAMVRNGVPIDIYP